MAGPLSIKPLRILWFLIVVGLIAAYLPHPSLGQPLPEKLMQIWITLQETRHE